MKILVTGSSGFIGVNFLQKFVVNGIDHCVWRHEEGLEELKQKLAGVQFIVHLAGVNRPDAPSDFIDINCILASEILKEFVKSLDGRRGYFLYCSSIHAADQSSDYGISKRRFEMAFQGMVREHSGLTGTCVRIPHLVGNFAVPFYNSVIATFAHQLSLGKKIQINEHARSLTIWSVEELANQVVDKINLFTRYVQDNESLEEFNPELSVRPLAVNISVSNLAARLERLVSAHRRKTVPSLYERLDSSLFGAMMNISEGMPNLKVSGPVHSDPRGSFQEFCRLGDKGQIGYFTCAPDSVRGGHFHFEKVEIFLVAHGSIRVEHYSVVGGKVLNYQDLGPGDEIKTIPGIGHRVINLSKTETAVVIVWASEEFDEAKADTYAC